MDKHIESLITSKTNIVLCFGDKGVGKTCFITILLKYLYKNHRLKFNSQYNPDGVAYTHKLLTDLDRGQLPNPTTMGNIEEVDINFSINNRDVIFTFLDIAGEDFMPIIPGTHDPITQELSKGVLSNQINKYLEHKELNITLLCFIDFNKPKEHDFLNSLFFNHLESFFDFGFPRVAVIVTKWDKNTDDKKLLEYLRQDAPQSYHWLNQMEVDYNAFKFSIGTLNDGDSTKLDSLNLSYCEEIIMWLYETCEYQIPPENGNQNNEGNIFKSMSLVVIQEIRQWVKLVINR